MVFHDADELDPDRHFKIAFADRRYRNQFAVAFSADGVSWQESSKNPVGPWLEMAGGTKVDETYFLTGQGGMHRKDQARQFATHVNRTTSKTGVWQRALVCNDRALTQSHALSIRMSQTRSILAPGFGIVAT